MSEELYFTKKRKMIFDVINKSKMPISAEDIYKLLSNEDINLSTIYRTLNLFEEKKIVDKIIRTDKKSYYTLKTKKHEHYIICKKCNNILELKSCPLEILYENNILEKGFEITNHTIEIEGICAKCKK